MISMMTKFVTLYVFQVLIGVAESYRFDIFYIGTLEDPNIQLVKVKGMEEIRGYQWGFRNPFTGAVNNGNMGTLEDCWNYH